MKSQRSITTIIICMLMLGIGAVLFTACADTDKQADQNKNRDMGVSPGVEQQMENNQQADQEKSFEATLDGSNEIPEVDTEASGSATVTLRGDSLHIEGDFSGLSGEYTASHIHKGAENENGKPTITLEPNVGPDNTSGSWDTSYMLDRSQRKALKSDSLYINVHSSEHTSGEIRGQLTASGIL